MEREAMLGSTLDEKMAKVQIPRSTLESAGDAGQSESYLGVYSGPPGMNRHTERRLLKRLSKSTSTDLKPWAELRGIEEKIERLALLVHESANLYATVSLLRDQAAELERTVRELRKILQRHRHQPDGLPTIQVNDLDSVRSRPSKYVDEAAEEEF